MTRSFPEQGFHRLESGGESQPYILDEGRLAIGAGKHHFEVIKPSRDLDSPERHLLHANIGSLLITPGNYDIEQHQGFKGLRDGEIVEVGRDAAGRFTSLPVDRHVSRSHFDILFRSGNVMVRDRRSTNGTWVKWHDLNTPDLAPSMNTPEAAVSVRVGGESLASDRHPDYNQDALFVDSKIKAVGVFDGMGSHDDSGDAAMIAATLTKRLLEKYPSDLPLSIAKMQVEEIMQKCHQAITAQGIEGGTTATFARVYEQEGEAHALIGSVGDSRAYLLRSGELTALTLDHGFQVYLSTEEQWNLQRTFSQVKNAASLTPQEQALFNHRNIISSVLGSSGPAAINIETVPLQKGDRLVLTTDGVHDNLTTDEIQAVCSGNPSAEPQQIAALLTRAAQQVSRRGQERSKADDITAAVLEV